VLCFDGRVQGAQLYTSNKLWSSWDEESTDFTSQRFSFLLVNVEPTLEAFDGLFPNGGFGPTTVYPLGCGSIVRPPHQKSAFSYLTSISYYVLRIYFFAASSATATAAPISWLFRCKEGMSSPRSKPFVRLYSV
jgi:hypothetical protein